MNFLVNLKTVNFLKECDTKDVPEPHGHLLIDFDTKLSEFWRICSNVVGPGTTIFHLPASQAKIAEIKNGGENFFYI